MSHISAKGTCGTSGAHTHWLRGMVSPPRVPSPAQECALHGSQCLLGAQAFWLCQVHVTALRQQKNLQFFCVCVPEHKNCDLMKEAHGEKFAGHFSSRRVYSMLAKRYWWDGMYKDVHTYCRSCLSCATYQGTGRRTKSSLTVGCPFSQVGVDIMELPLIVNRNRYVIVI